MAKIFKFTYIVKVHTINTKFRKHTHDMALRLHEGLKIMPTVFTTLHVISILAAKADKRLISCCSAHQLGTRSTMSSTYASMLKIYHQCYNQYLTKRLLLIIDVCNEKTDMVKVHRLVWCHCPREMVQKAPSSSAQIFADDCTNKQELQQD